MNKKWSKFLLYATITIALIVLMVITYGCKTSEVITTTKEEPKLEEIPGYEYWKPKSFEELLGKIDLFKRVGFYNSSDIQLLDTLGKNVPSVDKEGVVHITDSLGYFNKTIPAFTKGDLILKTSIGKNSPITVSFPLEGKRYELEFILIKDSTFFLSDKKITVLIKKKNSQIKPKTSSDCRVLYKRILDSGEQTIE